MGAVRADDQCCGAAGGACQVQAIDVAQGQSFVLAGGGEPGDALLQVHEQIGKTDPVRADLRGLSQLFVGRIIVVGRPGRRLWTTYQSAAHLRKRVYKAYQEP